MSGGTWSMAGAASASTSSPSAGRRDTRREHGYSEDGARPAREGTGRVRRGMTETEGAWVCRVG